MVLFTVLYLNKLWLNSGKLLPYKVAVFVAESKREEMNSVIKTINKFITNHLKKF
jgi:hypothetical protein